MADKATNNYEQFVVVDETEWKFDYGVQLPMTPACTHCTITSPQPICSNCQYQLQFTPNPHTITKHSLKMGTVEWNIAFTEQTKKLELSCQNVAEGTVDEVHMELVSYRRNGQHENYEQTFQRHIFTSSANLLSLILIKRDNVFTIRILKDRPLFPDFTLESTVIGRMGADGKLRVADQVFYVNKQLLSMYSDHFDRMYNGPYKEANQEEIELKHEQADPAVFHDFLLVICVNEALPNFNNVAAMSALANIYQTANVRDKCQRHLRICREMPMEQRYVLALENGNKELQTSIIRNMPNLEEAARIIAAVSEKAVAL